MYNKNELKIIESNVSKLKNIGIKLKKSFLLKLYKSY